MIKVSKYQSILVFDKTDPKIPYTLAKNCRSSYSSIGSEVGPVGALKFARQSLKPNGTCMIIEPMAKDKLEDNINLMGKTSYSVSSIICVPNSLTDNGPALGAQAGEERTRKIAEESGFSEFKKQLKRRLI